jgi:uncharacterized peroxidase-related enzyme
MARLAIPTRDASPAASQKQLDAVGAKLGVIPNLFRLVGTSPAALEGYLGLSAALGRTLDLKTRERIALTVAQVNGCDYCLSAHSYIGQTMAKLDPAEIALARQGGSADARADAAVRFARKVVETRGQVSDTDLEAVKRAGFTDANVVEIVLVVAENVLTNLLNNVARTDIDFPVVTAEAA